MLGAAYILFSAALINPSITRHWRL